MAIDTTCETVFPMASEGPKRVAPMLGGRRVHSATLFRWRHPGLRGIKLETIKIGGSTCTSVEALQRFFTALSAASAPDDRPVPRTPVARQRDLARTDRELNKLGV